MDPDLTFFSFLEIFYRFFFYWRGELLDQKIWMFVLLSYSSSLEKVKSVVASALIFVTAVFFSWSAGSTSSGILLVSPSFSFSTTFCCFFFATSSDHRVRLALVKTRRTFLWNVSWNTEDNAGLNLSLMNSLQLVMTSFRHLAKGYQLDPPYPR